MAELRSVVRAVVPLPARRFARWLLGCGPPLPMSRWRFAGKWQRPERIRDQPLRRFGAASHQRIHLAVRKLASAHRPLPDYLGIGVVKGGTSSLFAYLREHPQVAPPVRKEIRYFVDANYAHGEAWYRAHFPLAAQRASVERSLGLPTYTGEVTPSYLFRPHVPERVAALLPSVKLVVLLRDPTDRAVSHYEMMRRNGVESRPFAQVVAAGLAGRRDEGARDWPVLEAGYYAKHLRRWYRLFDRDQLLIVPTESLTRDGAIGYQRILAFLGLEPQDPPLWERGVGGYPGHHAEARSVLRDHYQPHNEELWDLIGERWGWDDTP